MHRRSRILVFRTVWHFWPLLLGLWLAPAAAADIRGRIVGIADGDTLTLLDGGNQQHKIRIAGIDAPEKRQPFGQRSKENLSRMAFARGADASCPKRDRYRREVCTVTVDGRDVGLEQVRAGFAWWYRRYSAEQSPTQRADYASAETQAKALRMGLWSEAAPTPPWEFRHPQK